MRLLVGLLACALVTIEMDAARARRTCTQRAALTIVAAAVYGLSLFTAARAVMVGHSPIGSGYDKCSYIAALRRGLASRNIDKLEVPWIAQEAVTYGCHCGGDWGPCSRGEDCKALCALLKKV